MLNIFLFLILIFFIIFYFTKNDTLNKKKLNSSDQNNKRSVFPNENTSFSSNLVRRKELKKLLDSNFCANDKKYILKLFDNKCYKCGSTEHLEIDHHVPLTIGYALKEGKNYNAVILCKKCNRKKSDRLPYKFYNNSELKTLEIKYNIKTHLNIDHLRIKKINKILISEKIKLLNRAISDNLPISFIYIEMSQYNIFHEKHYIKAVPVEIYENIIFTLNSKKKIYILKALITGTNTIEEFEIMYIIDLII